MPGKAQLESTVSMLIAYMRAERPEVEVDADSRRLLKAKIEDIVEEYQPDTTNWPNVRHQYFYDVYIEMRREEKTLTEFDLVRPGLTRANFADEAQYFNHMMRIAESRKASAGKDEKKCSACGLFKPESAFKKKGGAKCNSCRSKEYRNRKADDRKEQDK